MCKMDLHLYSSDSCIGNCLMLQKYRLHLCRSNLEALHLYGKK